MMPTVKCPKCGAPSSLKENAWRPFCSERCKTSDLGAWAEGRYAIPGEEVELESESGEHEMLDGRTLH